MTDREERLIEALHRIRQWADAYPEAIFPKPSDLYLQRANEVLQQHGMSIDRIAADCMRHVIQGVGKIVREVLQDDSLS